MAGELIDNALVIQFSAQVHVLAQQMESRLRPFVEVRPMSGETYAYDGLGPVEAAPVVGRQQPVQFSDINHLRRQIARQRFALTLPIDKADVAGLRRHPAADLREERDERDLADVGRFAGHVGAGHHIDPSGARV